MSALGSSKICLRPLRLQQKITIKLELQSEYIHSATFAILFSAKYTSGNIMSEV